ncbi:unnamed protein product, partial [Ceratitis capitata]
GTQRVRVKPQNYNVKAKAIATLAQMEMLTQVNKLESQQYFQMISAVDQYGEFAPIKTLEAIPSFSDDKN